MNFEHTITRCFYLFEFHAESPWVKPETLTQIILHLRGLSKALIGIN